MLNNPECEGIHEELERLRSRTIRDLRFTKRDLEEQFEHDTAKERAYRLWLEGLFAILFLNICLVSDYLLLKDPKWQTIVARTMLVTPLALPINLLMLRNPPRWIREASVAIGTVLICYANLYIQGNATATASAYGLMCVLITILFADLVMRLRMRYALGSTLAMFLGEMWSLVHTHAIQRPAKIGAASLLGLAIAITLMAAYDLERKERLNYLNHLRSEIQNEELLALNEQLQHLSTIDQLTGLPNRRAFDGRLKELWAESERLKRPLSAIIVDADRFKRLNDSHGHLYGDKVLQHIARVLSNVLRTYDFAARIGGEEFAVLLPNTAKEEAFSVAERARASVERSMVLGPEESVQSLFASATISCGLSVCIPEAGIFRDDLLRTADLALYQAKDRGRNQVVYLELAQQA